MSAAASAAASAAQTPGGFTFTLPLQYGYCVLAVASTFLVDLVAMGLVVMARKQYNVEYPHCYAPEKHENKKEFDSAQRQHQNFLERVHFVNFSVLLVGVFYPNLAAVYGFVFSVSRLAYLYGYAKFGPKGRLVGALGAQIAQFVLLAFLFHVRWKLKSARVVVYNRVRHVRLQRGLPDDTQFL